MADLDLSVHAESMQDAFFRKEDEKLIENLRIMRKLTETREALRNVSGITDEHLLNRLVELNVRPETLASFALIPLIEVAWADGSIDPKEKAAFLKAADSIGMGFGSVDYQLLEEWSAIRPEPALFTAWEQFAADLCRNLGAADKTCLAADIIGHAKVVAAASGGLLGMGSVSKEEKAVLDRLEKALG